MRTRATRQGHVVALCDCCSNTIEFIGLQQAEEKIGAEGWTVRHGKTRCTTCSEFERQVLTRSLARLGVGRLRSMSLANPVQSKARQGGCAGKEPGKP
jgi:hypothetical protein